MVYLVWIWLTKSEETLRCEENVHLILFHSGSYLQSCSIWSSFSRGLSMHRTWGLRVESNIFYKIIGHALLVGK